MNTETKAPIPGRDQYYEHSFEFTSNWNNKLDCDCFSTIRLHNPNKHVMGRVYHIVLNKHLKLYPAELVYITTITLDKMTEGMAYLDTGYNLKEMKDIIFKMYNKKVHNIKTQKFDFIILRYRKEMPLYKQQAFDFNKGVRKLS
jgi:hypothetical protein